MFLSPLYNSELSNYIGRCVYIEKICKDVECGKGSCEAAAGKPFNFVCKCEKGWKRTRHDDDDDEDDLQFLPCIVPKCQ